MNRTIPLADLRLGMVLGEAATVNGQVLLASGTTLSAAHLAALTSCGVRSLSIKAADEQRAPIPINAKLVLAIDRNLRPRFARTDLQHPAMKEVYRLALVRRIQQTVNQLNPAPKATHES